LHWRKKKSEKKGKKMLTSSMADSII